MYLRHVTKWFYIVQLATYMQQSIQNNEFNLLGFHNTIKNSVQFENYV